MVVQNCRAEIERSTQLLKSFLASKELYKKEKDILELMQHRYKLNYSQIHLFLAPKKSKDGEKEIRSLIKDIHGMDLPICESKIRRFQEAITAYEKKKDEKSIDLCYRFMQEWLILYENNYALVAFRSLEHWAYFSEWDTPDSNKFWKYSIDTFNDGGYSGCTKGFFYYGNQMVLDNDIKFIMKQLPTSFGKSRSDSVMISFIFGVDPTEQVIKVVGNARLPLSCTRQVVELMCNKRYRQVFPYYAALVDESKKDIASQIFDTCAIKEGVLAIKGSGKDTSFQCFSKETDRDGIRGGFLFLDDIVQRSEAFPRIKLNVHEKDLDSFDGTWKKRSRDEKTFRIVCGGTTYDIYDLLSTLRFRYSSGKMKKSPINKWTTLNMDGTAAFVKVPKLDEKDELTFPQKTVLANVLADKHNNPALFQAMDMQEPIAPEENPFYWDYMRQYDFVPSEASDYCLATLDPARTGDNYVSMPICKIVKELDDYGNMIERHYLIDALYRKAPMDTVYGMICDLIEEHHIIKLHIERNTDTSLKFLLDKMLKERGVNFCEISEVYSTKNKEDRIYADETTIKNQIVIPKREMYSRSSEIGLFEHHVISYTYKNAEYDDSIDSLGLYADKFIGKKQEKAKAKILKI